MKDRRPCDNSGRDGRVWSPAKEPPKPEEAGRAPPRSLQEELGGLAAGGPRWPPELGSTHFCVSSRPSLSFEWQSQKAAARRIPHRPAPAPRLASCPFSANRAGWLVTFHGTEAVAGRVGSLGSSRRHSPLVLAVSVAFASPRACAPLPEALRPCRGDLPHSAQPPHAHTHSRRGRWLSSSGAWPTPVTLRTRPNATDLDKPVQHRWANVHRALSCWARCPAWGVLT